MNVYYTGLYYLRVLWVPMGTPCTSGVCASHDKLFGAVYLMQIIITPDLLDDMTVHRFRVACIRYAGHCSVIDED